MSRPSSSKGKKGKKGQTKSPKQQVKELTEQNAELMKQLDENRENLKMCEDKLSFLTVTLLRNIDPRDFGVRPDADPLLVPTKALEQMVSSLSAKKKVREVSVEARIEELETRVTQMNSEMAKMCKKSIAYENGLHDLLSSTNLDEVKDKIYDLQFIAGKQYESITVADYQTPKPPTIDGIERRHDTACKRMIDNEIELNLVPPADKLPGDTHISDMHKNLRLHLINELSYTKRSGKSLQAIPTNYRRSII